jgi:hypothetical protein
MNEITRKFIFRIEEAKNRLQNDLKKLDDIIIGMKSDDNYWYNNFDGATTELMNDLQELTNEVGRLIIQAKEYRSPNLILFAGEIEAMKRAKEKKDAEKKESSS